MVLKFHFLYQDQTYHLPHPLQAGESIIFKSVTIDLNPTTTGLDTIDNSALNLLNGHGQHLLHISIRRTENVVVCNSNIGGWGPEERISLSGLFCGGGPNASVSVMDLGEAYQITFDHNPDTSYLYNKRSYDEVVAVSCTLNQGVSPVFSNPLFVEVLGVDGV